LSSFQTPEAQAQETLDLAAGPYGSDAGDTCLPKVLLEALACGKARNAEGVPIPLHSNIAKSEALELYQVVRETKPKASAEVGFAQGISALAILKALQDNGAGLHHVMDPFQENFHDAGLAMVSHAALDGRLKYYRAFAEEVFPVLPALQFVFIDASHLFDLTMLEFVLADKKLDVGGIIAFHDMWMPSLRKVVRYVLSNRNYSVYRQPNRLRSPAATKVRFKAFLAGTLRKFPGIDFLLQPEILYPWSKYSSDNLIFLQKNAADERDWRFHRSF
jgi:predicted O-methyltransferase YrrM